MKLSKLIQQAQDILDREGDLDVLNEVYSGISFLTVEEADGLPEYLDLPIGTKFVMIYDTI